MLTDKHKSHLHPKTTQKVAFPERKGDFFCREKRIPARLPLNSSFSFAIFGHFSAETI